MRLCVATTWDDNLLRNLCTLNTADARVYEVFGSLPRSIVGGGREGSSLPHVDEGRVSDHIELAHSLGMKFNYLLNAPCMGNVEFTYGGLKQLRSYLKWVGDLGADMVTVSIPYLIDLIHEECPSVGVNVSTINEVRTVQTAKHFASMGVDRITVSTMANRNLTLLKQIKEDAGCELEVLANEGCTWGCPYRTYHYLLMGHASQEETKDTTSFIDWPLLRCSMDRLRNPEEIIKAGWIRPEDVILYEEIGVDLIKIAGRTQTPDYIFRAATAYAHRSHKGNLAEIVDIPLRRTGYYPMHSVKEVDKTWIFIDNDKLDGFLKKVSAVDCERMCGRCVLCKDTADKSVIIEGKDEYLEALENIEKSLSTE